MNMNTNNIHRFLYESALFLDLDPAQALGAEVDAETESESESGAAETDNDGVCRLFYKGPHPDLLPEGEGLLGYGLPVISWREKAYRRCAIPSFPRREKAYPSS
ncbi:MAG: hypothetical protein U5P41_01950 [Gammaproteobacteria bacterium]|nr:hypothetical protein [Gammaproteobacteria bacterium]